MAEHITEKPYYDENGNEIKELDVIKVFHFIGRRRKKHYMYKWIWLHENENQRYWVAKHLSSKNPFDFVPLKALDKYPNGRHLKGVEIVQSF